jgi:hypothetical protein
MELSAAEVNTQIHRVLDLGADPNPKAGPAPLHEKVASTRVIMFGPISVAYMILSFDRAYGFALGLEGICSELRNANLPKEVVRQEMKHASNEKVQAREERKQARSAACRKTRERGLDTPPPHLI